MEDVVMTVDYLVDNTVVLWPERPNDQAAESRPKRRLEPANDNPEPPLPPATSARAWPVRVFPGL
jgi:hypothetical protein